MHINICKSQSLFLFIEIRLLEHCFWDSNEATQEPIDVDPLWLAFLFDYSLFINNDLRRSATGIFHLFQPLLPSIFSANDVTSILTECLKRHPGAIVCCDTIVASNKLITECSKPFPEIMAKKAEKVILVYFHCFGSGNCFNSASIMYVLISSCFNNVHFNK